MTSFNKTWTQVLCRIKSCLRHVGDLWWWGYLTMVPAGNKVACLLSVNHTTNSSSSSSSSSTEFKDTLPWNISQMITKTIPISTRIVISYAMKRGIPLWIWWKVNGNWDNNMIRISQWRESHCRTNTSVRRKKEIQNCRTVRVTGRDPTRKVNYLSKVVRDRKIITEFTRSISSTRIDQSVLVYILLIIWP